MATYIMLANWTEQGIRNVKDSPSRLDAARQLCKKNGAEIKQLFMTMGTYDLVLVVEAPSDEAVAKIALATGAGGNIRTTTMKAFNEAEYRQLTGSVG
jgi:uncharacterized protein with GYD domain